MKEPKMKKALLIITAQFVTYVSFAQTKIATDKPIEADNMRCAKIMGRTLAEFKEELIGNCNVEKPFSTSLSTVLNGDTYFYCCHKKK